MFKNGPPLLGGNLVGFRSHASVPSIGGSSLQAALARVRVVEQALTVAREEARAAARKAGVSLAGLFARTEMLREVRRIAGRPRHGAKATRHWPSSTRRSRRTK